MFQENKSHKITVVINSNNLLKHFVKPVTKNKKNRTFLSFKQAQLLFLLFILFFYIIYSHIRTTVRKDYIQALYWLPAAEQGPQCKKWERQNWPRVCMCICVYVAHTVLHACMCVCVLYVYMCVLSETDQHD